MGKRNDRERPGRDIIYGRNPILEALNAGRPIDRIYIKDGLNHPIIGKIRDLAKEKGVRYDFAEGRRLDKMCEGGAHQGVVAIVSAYSYGDVEDILRRAEERGTDPFVVICDGITDPRNLGSIIRTANGAGASGVIIPKNRSVQLTATVEKASAGALEYTLVARVANLSSAIEKLKKRGLWVVGTDLSAERSCYDQDLTGPLAVVIGSEGEGMSRIVREHCDFLVKIPMFGETESLNASVAAGILLYEAVRQRNNTRE